MEPRQNRGVSTGRQQRNRFAQVALLAALGLGAVACGDDDDSAAQPKSCYKLADGKCVEETFKNPPLLQANADGVYEVELKPTEFSFNGQRHCTRAYNGLYPAPTIDTPKAKDGEKRSIRFNLRNGFTKADYHSLHDETCTCKDSSTGQSCVPSGGHSHMAGGCECTNEKGEMCHVFDFNTTNVHAHGVHVRPDYSRGGDCVEGNGLSCRACDQDANNGDKKCYFADDVITHVLPGAGVQHRWDIDEDETHPAGLDWYHPHIHGTTAIQVASGATGTWIIRGELDEIPGIKNAKERIILFTTPPVTYEPLKDGDPCDEDHITFNDFTVLGSTADKQTNLINGIRRPRMVMPPGQIERWRFLHGAFLDEVALALFKAKDSDCNDLNLDEPPVPLTQIGRDGIPLPKPESGEDWPFAPDYLFMAPGYRIEALLDGSSVKHGETLCLMAGRFLQEDTTGTVDEPVGITKTPTAEELLKAASNGDLVAIVNVTNDAGQPSETQMPDLEKVAAQSPSMKMQGGKVDALAKCDEVTKITKPEEIDQLSELWMLFYNTEGYDKCSCGDHNINCKNFEDTDRTKYPYDRVFKKGDIEHWRAISGFDGHPFHIHINPFLVCPLPPAGSNDKNTKSRLFEPPFAHWRDTYLVNLDRQLDMLTEYKSYTGAFVYHCHKLNHEDHGMMELVKVCDPAEEDCDKLCAGGKCGWRDCAEGDGDCIRALAATDCILDPTKCPEAALRCQTCSDSKSCPSNAHCSEEASHDGETRCLPGCETNDDCAPTDSCDNGTCKIAMCTPPCAPPQMCNHGVCE